MPLHQTGKIAEDVYILGHASMPVFLFDGDRPTLIDAGLDGLAPAYLADLEKFLGGRAPARLLLTHSHFDHVGAAPAFIRRYPGLEVAASARAARVLAKPKVRAMIRDLNAAAINFFASTEFALPTAVDYEPFTGFEVTRFLEPGEVLPLSADSSIEVIAAPGHTRDFLSYYLPDRKILVASEAGGSLNPGCDYIVSENLVGYALYRESLTRLAALPADLILLGHHYHLVGPEAREFLFRSLDQCRLFYDWVAGLLDQEGGDLEAVIARVKVEEWDRRPMPKQPEPAYLLNLRERVRGVRDHLGRWPDRPEG
jgi:glyoxylase-like metal-dependent hydrolase (beta-lactamase superfamily II)